MPSQNPPTGARFHPLRQMPVSEEFLRLLEKDGVSAATIRAIRRGANAVRIETNENRSEPPA